MGRLSSDAPPAIDLRQDSMRATLDLGVVEVVPPSALQFSAHALFPGMSTAHVE
jgi:hypothetical protein